MAACFRAFLCCMLAGNASTTNNSANLTAKLLTKAAMVDNLAEKVEKCPLNRGR